MYKSSNNNSNRSNSKNIPNYTPMLEKAINALFDVEKVRMVEPKAIHDTGYNAMVKTKEGNAYYVIGVHHKKWDDYDSFALWENKERVIKNWADEYDNYVIVVYDPYDPENKASVVDVHNLLNSIAVGEVEESTWSDGMGNNKRFYRVKFDKQ